MTIPPDSSPARLGYRWPAEWEPHRATWLSWPHKEASWPGKFAPVPGIFVEMVRALLPGERVEILVLDEAHEASVRDLLASQRVELERIGFHRVPTNDAWIRDHGPTFLELDDAAARGLPPELMLDWGYNAWGGKYPPWDDDDAVPRALAERLRLPVVSPGMILEGGSIDGNGAGTILTTEACLLNPNRNPALDRTAIEARLRDYLGARHVVWLGDGIVGDDTDGHVDDLTRFVDPRTVVTVVEPDPADANHGPLAENRERLRRAVDQDGRPFVVVELPMPRPVVHDGTRLPASYANFYIGNRAVLVPTFRDPADRRALGILQELFPGRTVIGIEATDLVWGLGAFHCATQQQPA